MGEYAEQYTLETFGVDICIPAKKKPWKWSCNICKKNLASEVSLSQHMRMKHAKRIENNEA